jgi:DNA modification methylase
MNRKNPCQEVKSKLESIVNNAVESKVENIILEKKLIVNNVENEVATSMAAQSKHEVKYDNMTDEEQTPVKYDLTNNIQLYIGDSLKNNINTKFRMIYFDPPFNSDRNYNLSSNCNIGFSDKWTDSDYESFISDNIDKFYDMLENDGTLFFHISSSCMYIPEKNLRSKFKFVEPIFWKKCRSKNNVKTKLGSVMDIIWKCNKTKSYKFNIVLQEKDETYLKNSFKNKDERGNYSLGHVVTEKTKKGYKYEVKIGNQVFNPNSGWRIKEDELQKLIKDKRIHLPKKNAGNLYKKIYLHEHPGKPCTDLWDDIHSISQGNEVRKYPTAKPVKLLERLINISTDENDYIYDPMCGSGTTAEAAYNLNRKCIINDMNKDIIPIVKSRFNNEQ